MAYRGDRGRGRGGGDRGRGGAPRGFGGGPGRGGAGVFSPPGPAPSVDSRLTDGSEDAFVRSLASLRINDTDLPNRPDFGTVGTPVKLRANFFPINVPRRQLYEYDVSISPTSGTANRNVKRRIFHLASQTREWSSNGLLHNVAHDNSAKLISSVLLNQPLAIPVSYTDENETTQAEPRVYTLTITYIQPLDTGDLINYLNGDPRCKGRDIAPLLGALNIILAAHPGRPSPGGGVLVGKNRFFFPSATPPVNLGGGLEAWRGFYSSVRPSFRQLMVNVNVCTTAFYKPGNLAKAMIEFERSTFGARYNAFARLVRVKAIHLGYRKTVKSVTNILPREHKFNCQELGGVVDVITYFKRKYNITLQYHNLPLVDVGGQKSNYLPPELCEILPNQPFRGKLTDEHTANMIQVAAQPPHINASAIVGKGLDELGFRAASRPLASFGIQIGTNMTVVPGRILPPPTIQYGHGTPRVDDRASWNLRDVRFTRGGKLEKWVVLLIQDGGRDEFTGTTDPELKRTVDSFVKMCSTSGINVVGGGPLQYLAARLPPKDPKDPIRGAAIAHIRDTLRKLNSKPSFVFVILSNTDKHIYSGLKHLCDSYLDIATVCVTSSKFRKEKGQLQYFANVALKVNMKLGGINHRLNQQSMGWLSEMPTMLVGIDVTHPGPGSVKGTPSIAAVVASTGSDFAQYPASLEIQESKKEMVTNLSNMMVERLLAFRAANSNRLPQRILVYRDGVSEGQFPIVVAEELPAIRGAFRKFDSSQGRYQPKLTIVICGKRHHTRFYPIDSAGADHNGNPKAGTVVDRGVTAVYEFDFFLQAHGGLQGTTKPTHYYVVHDEIGFRADQLQTLTNAVSYMYSRATKAVSLASPAYYADLACERGRCYIHKLLHGHTSVNLHTQTADDDVMEEAAKSFNKGPGVAQKKIMFYL